MPFGPRWPHELAPLRGRTLPNGAGVQARILSRDAVAFLRTMNAVEAAAAELWAPGALVRDLT